jgi:hypothetical protein
MGGMDLGNPGWMQDCAWPILVYLENDRGYENPRGIAQG